MKKPSEDKGILSFWQFGVLALLCVLTFWPMFRNGFVWDDQHFIVENPAILGLWPPARFLQPQSSEAKGAIFPITGERPVMVFSLALDYALWKLNPFGYHLSNLLLHLLCVFGVAWLARRLTLSRDAGFLAGALFALHPGHAEGVIAFLGRSDLLACLFVLLGFFGYIRHREAKGWSSAGWYWGSLLSFLIACFSKETGLVLLAVLAVYEGLGISESRTLNQKFKIVRLVPFILAGLFYWVYRGRVLRGQAGTAWWGGSLYKNFLMAFEVYARYLRLLFFPLSLSPLHTVPVPGGFGDLRVLWGMVLLLGSLGGTVWLLRRHPWTGFLVSWFLIGLVPVANIIPIPGVMILAERWLYLPSVGACVLGGWGAWMVYRGGRGWGRRVWAGLVVLILVLFGARTFLWSSPWRTEESIARTIVVTSPYAAVGYYNLGCALLAQGRIEEAASAFCQALKISPDFAEGHDNLGVALYDQGKFAEAEKECREAIRLNPDYAEAHNILGIALREQGRNEEAEIEYREAIRLNPNYAEAYNNLGNALGRQGRLVEAEQDFREAIRLKPDFAEAHYNLGNALRGQGRNEEAEKEYREAILLKPNFAE